MAAASTAFAAATGSAVLAPSAGLSSSNAFRTTSLVQFAPVNSSKKCNRVVAARAALSEDSKAARREVLVSILGAGAALGFTGEAFADILSSAKGKADEALSGAKNSAPKLPSLPKSVPKLPKIPSLPKSPELPSVPSTDGALEGVQGAAENVKSSIGGSIDGIFGKGKAGPLKSKAVGSTNGGTGSAIGDAKKRIGNFGKNPFATNLEKASKDAEVAVSTGPDSARVDAATKKVEGIGADLQKKGSDTIGEGKGFVGQAQGSVPSLPNLVPKAPSVDIPSIPTPELKVPDVKGKVEEAKSAAGGLFK